MKVDGACHCGGIRFEAEVDPATSALCHCTDCQTLSGAAYRANVRTVKGGFRLLAGTPKIYVKTAESGTKRAHGFCPDCGTSLYSTSVSDPQIHGLRLGTLRQKNELPPQSMGWCRSMQPWAADISALPRFEKQRP
ncbi:MAG: GFA family protein [Burkholderiales bacterium]|nr:GFA family protein [Burkholderiales bacterium]